jgi:hypothetical protein
MSFKPDPVIKDAVSPPASVPHFQPAGKAALDEGSANRPDPADSFLGQNLAITTITACRRASLPGMHPLRGIDGNRVATSEARGAEESLAASCGPARWRSSPWPQAQMGLWIRLISTGFETR